MFVLTYYEKHDDVKRQVNYYKFIETLNNQKVLPGRLIITNEEAPLTEEQATKHFASIDEQTAAIVADPNDVTNVLHVRWTFIWCRILQVPLKI